MNKLSKEPQGNEANTLLATVDNKTYQLTNEVFKQKIL